MASRLIRLRDLFQCFRGWHQYPAEVVVRGADIRDALGSGR